MTLRSKVHTPLNEGLRTLVFCLFCLFFGSCFSQQRTIQNKTVIKVNKTEVSAQEFSERLALNLKHFDALAAKDEANLKRAKEQALQSFVMEIVTKDYASRNDLTVKSDELDAEVERVRKGYEDDLSFRRALAQENLPLDRWKESLSFTLLQRKVFSHILAGSSAPTEKELQDYYDANRAKFDHPARIHLRQIVLEKEDNAGRVIEALQKGKDFAQLAKEFSVAPEGVNGGLVGWIDKGTLEVFDSVFKLPVGGRSKVLKSPYGYHIIEVLKKEPEGRLSFPEVKTKIRAQLMENREQKAFSSWLEQEIRKSSVFRNEPLIDSIKVTTRGT